jgi:hypothetical protein
VMYITLMLIKLIYLVRNELILIELKKYSLSRKIRFQKHSKFDYDFVKKPSKLAKYRLPK